MKVLQVTPSFYPATVDGGPMVTVYALCGALAQAGCEVRVCTVNGDGPGATTDVSVTQLVALPNGARARYFARQAGSSVSLSMLRYLPEAIRWADVVHLQAVYSFPTMPVLSLCSLLGRPLVWTPRGALQRWSGSTSLQAKAAWEAICRKLKPRNTVLHVTSQQEADESLERIRGVPTCDIPNGIEVPDRRDRRAYDGTSALKLLFIGRIHEKKGIENLLTACSQLELDWRLTIAGDGSRGYVDQIRALVRQLDLNERVTMAGFVRGDEREDLFFDSDLVVVPSFTENFAMVIGEALAREVPVIASHGTPWRDIEKHGAGRWVDNSPASLKAALEDMAQQPLTEMGQRGRAWMLQDLSWESVGTRMCAVYDGLVSRT